MLSFNFFIRGSFSWLQNLLRPQRNVKTAASKSVLPQDFRHTQDKQESPRGFKIYTSQRLCVPRQKPEGCIKKHLASAPTHSQEEKTTHSVVSQFFFSFSYEIFLQHEALWAKRAFTHTLSKPHPLLCCAGDKLPPHGITKGVS